MMNRDIDPGAKSKGQVEEEERSETIPIAHVHPGFLPPPVTVILTGNSLTPHELLN